MKESLSIKEALDNISGCSNHHESGKKRSAIKPGLIVDIIQKQDQRTGKTTRGIVREILTGSPTHPHGIKVRLTTGQVGRVSSIIHK
ncbi:MAG: YwbE family protein [Methanomicrobiales archaeon]|nr:YwbE family protein [Methanomicrobiales archaeon]